MVVVFGFESLSFANSRWEEGNDPLQWAVTSILPVLKILLFAVTTDFCSQKDPVPLLIDNFNSKFIHGCQIQILYFTVT